jgi:uncharacterized protein YfeS
MNGEPHFKQAHPRAQQLMDEEFYYSSIEESGPFGSDDGAETFMGFSEWRTEYPDADPLVYLHQQLEEWNYPPLDLQEQHPEVIRQYLEENEMGVSYLVGMDAAVVALAFGQLYLEGKIDAALNEWAMISLNRQLQPELLELWDETYQPIRKEQLEKMKTVLVRAS